MERVEGLTVAGGARVDVAQTHGLGSLTPEAVLHLMRNRIADIDSQIAGLTEEMQDTTAHIEACSEKLDALDAVRKRFLSDAKPGDKTDMNQMMDGGLSIWGYLKAHGVTEEDLGLGGLDMNLSLDQLDTTQKQINRQISSINSGTERKMIQYQTLVQQRSEAISLCTNTVKTLQEALQGIVRNIG